jgi:RNA polymerase sigma factor (sigma-70 family)
VKTERLTDAISPPPPNTPADAIDDIVARWQRPLFAFAWRYLHQHADAEDLVIETFVRWHEHHARLRPDTNVPAWLFTTLANLCHNQHRWRQRHPEVSFDTPAAEPAMGAVAAVAAEKLEDAEIAEVVRAAIDRLPHDQRTAILLHHYEQLGYREIAAIVGCSERGVETRLYRARERLRTDLAPLLHECAAPH